MAATGKAITSLAALLLMAAVYTQFKAVAVGDTMILIVNARMLLDGKRLYHDIFTVQPPLIACIYALPVGLARIAHFPDKAMVVVTGLSLVALSVFVCGLVFRGRLEKPDILRHCLLLASVFITATSPAFFFDREHIFLLLTLPYLLRFMPGDSGSLSVPLRLLIGLMAGIGFCIKPHCMIIFATIQLLILFRPRRIALWLSLENLLVYGVAAIYIAAIYLFTPEYIRIILPMALETYSAASMRVNGLLYGAIALVLLAIPFADFRWRATSPYRRDIYYLLALCPAFLLYALTNNGWGYTYSPLINWVLILTMWMWQEYRWLAQDAEKNVVFAKTPRFGARACALSLAAVIVFSAISGFCAVTTRCTEGLRCSRMGNELIAAIDGHRSFGVISGDFDIWARLSDATGASWDTRFNHLWMLPKFFVSREEFTTQHRWIPEYVANALAEDLKNRRPEILFIENSDIFYLTPVHVDLLEYFSNFPEFNEALARYTYKGSVHSCSHPEMMHCSFEVFKRITKQAAPY